MKKIALINVLAILFFIGKAYALNYQIAEYTPDPTPPQFIVPAQLYTDVAALGGTNTVVSSHNSSGQIVGYSTYYHTIYQTEFESAFLWDATNGVSVLAGMSHAMDINEAGQVVGFKALPWYEWVDASVWDNTNGYQNLGTLGYKFSYAEGINDLGWVVGASAIPDSTSSNHAFIWNNQDGMKDLNDYLPSNSGWILNDAWDIDNSGVIIGLGEFNGQTRSFIMTPTIVPEPVSSILFITGGILLAGRRCIRRKA